MAWYQCWVVDAAVIEALCWEMLVDHEAQFLWESEEVEVLVFSRHCGWNIEVGEVVGAWRV